MLLSLLDRILRDSRLRKVIARASAALNVGDVNQVIQLLMPLYRNGPVDAAVLTLLGQALIASDQLDQGVTLLHKAVSVAPSFADARIVIARQLQYAGQIKLALEHLRFALEHAPDSPGLHRAILRPLLETCDWNAVERERSALRALVDARKPWTDYAAPMDVLLLGLPSAERRASAEARAREIRRWEQPNGPLAKRYTRVNGRLRIGYLSGDFRDHPVTHLAGNLFRRHDRSRFEIHAFSYGRDDGSPCRKQVMADADHFVDVRGLANADVARAIHDAGIDLLIDLAGHTDGSRLGVLAHRPAPVQAHYLGYPATTGADFVDYFLADRVVAPSMLDAEFTERFVRLPGCFMISDESIASCLSTQRAIHGLPENAFVFVNFNQNSRIDRSVFSMWMEILVAVPHSVLWLKYSNDLACENLRGQAENRGIEPHRIAFAPDVADKKAHISRLQLADLALDTVGRYNGHTSTADALWAGVPVVTTATDCFPGRVAASLLSAAGMEDCVVSDVAAYKAFAVRYASDRRLQRTIRSRLAVARNHASFFRPERVVHALESAYMAMWERFKTGRAPTAIDLNA